jgi:hypothetical protein
MNTANLQLQGLYLAIAAITKALVVKGLLTREEVDRALREAEMTSLADYRTDDAEAPNREAMAFAARFLRLVNNSGPGAQMPPFSDIARQVGEAKKSPHASR